MKRFKTLLYTIKLGLIEKNYYKKALVFDVIFTVITIYVYYFLWSVVYQNHSNIGGYTQAEMITYVVFSRILSLQYSSGINPILSNWIYEGKVGIELLRPISLITNLFYRRISCFAEFLIFKGIPVYIISFWGLNMNMPEEKYTLILFIVSILLSIIILFEIEFMVGILSVFTLYDFGLCTVKTVIISILSGALIPVTLLPNFLKTMVMKLPFVSLVQIPIDIFLEKYSLENCLESIIGQVGWGIVLGIMMVCVWGKLRKHIIVQGG